MKYLMLFENIQKAKSLMNRDNIDSDDVSFISRMISKYPSGYLGHIISLYLIFSKYNQDKEYCRNVVISILDDLKKIKLSTANRNFLIVIIHM